MLKVAIMMGIPCSGKSTMARDMMDEYVVINPDNVRLALHGQAFVPSAEQFIWATVDLMARTLLKTGHNVLIDATNTMEMRRLPWAKMAKEFHAEFTIFRVLTSLEECLQRNEEIGRMDPAVITRMYKQIEEPDTKKWNVILC
ncbi:MAG: AAA family ATPase [Candidatus Cloacimonetes bacterium]|nr:AAA family ATPase [Candidatus Cloacimonadota bacterium]